MCQHNRVQNESPLKYEEVNGESQQYVVMKRGEVWRFWSGCSVLSCDLTVPAKAGFTSLWLILYQISFWWLLHPPLTVLHHLAFYWTGDEGAGGRSYIAVRVGKGWNGCRVLGFGLFWHFAGVGWVQVLSSVWLDLVQVDGELIGKERCELTREKGDWKWRQSVSPKRLK